MTDLETRLATGLNGAAERAPQPGDLAGGARDRLRRRRRTTAATLAAALVVVAIPVGITVAGGGEEPDRRETATENATDGWRVESYRDLTLRVPPEWGWGGGTDWCADGVALDAATPRVARPGVVRTIRCTPAYGYGVVFAPGHLDVFMGDDTFPQDAFYDTVSTGRARAWIAAETRTQLDRILASVEPIRGGDANGCPPDVHTLVTRQGDGVSVCRYDSGELEQSELLSPADAAALLEAIEQAPRDDGGYLACPPYSFRQPVITLQSSQIDARLLPSEACTLSNVFLDGANRKLLTEDVLHWALSPGWSGAVSGDVPLPERLRTE